MVAVGKITSWQNGELEVCSMDGGAGLALFFTLSPIIMEVENGGLEDDFSLLGGHFPLP